MFHFSGTRLTHTKYSLRTVNCDDIHFHNTIGGDEASEIINETIHEIIVSICWYIVIDYREYSI